MKIDFELKMRCAKCGSDLCDPKLLRIHPGPTLTVAVTPCMVCMANAGGAVANATIDAIADAIGGKR